MALDPASVSRAASGARPTPAPVELIRALAVLVEPPGRDHAALVTELDLGAPVEAADYATVFLFQLYPYASVHLGEEGMLGGDARDRVAGFWRAVGRLPPAEPDHLASLLGLYAGLAEEEATAPTDSAQRLLLERSRSALLEEHVAPWVFGYLERVRAFTTGTYAAWAGLLARVLRREVGRVGPGAVARAPGASAHLSAVSPLPDPRCVPGTDFLAALLAPARTGMILARADLARVARVLDIGLRAGERRYALEHLLAQDAAGVLAALAREAGRQAEGHEARTGWLGPSADVLASRARRTERLLGELSEDAGG